MPAQAPTALTPEEETFQVAVAALRVEVPRPFPVLVEIVEIDGPYLGLTLLDPSIGGLRVLIESRQSFQGLIDALVHEWAHVAVWGASSEDSHDALWGVAYARCYRCVRRALDSARAEMQ